MFVPLGALTQFVGERLSVDGSVKPGVARLRPRRADSARGAAVLRRGAGPETAAVDPDDDGPGLLAVARRLGLSDADIAKGLSAVKGESMRLEVSRQHKRTRFSYDILYGVIWGTRGAFNIGFTVVIANGRSAGVLQRVVAGDDVLRHRA